MMTRRTRFSRRARFDHELLLPKFEKYLVGDFGVPQKLLKIESNERKMVFLEGKVEEPAVQAPPVSDPEISEQLVVQPVMFGSYLASGGDVDITPMVHQLWMKGHDYALPVQSLKREKFFYRQSYPHQKLVPGPTRTLVPKQFESPEVVPDVMLIPVLAFDRKDGFFVTAEGLGQVDVTLFHMRRQDAMFDDEIKRYGAPREAFSLARPEMNHDGIWALNKQNLDIKAQKVGLDRQAKPFIAIGVAWSCGEIDASKFPTDTFDEPLDAILTEKELIQIGPSTLDLKSRFEAAKERLRDHMVDMGVLR